MINRLWDITLDYMKWGFGGMLLATLIFGFISLNMAYPLVVGSIVSALIALFGIGWKWYNDSLWRRDHDHTSRTLLVDSDTRRVTLREAQQRSSQTRRAT